MIHAWGASAKTQYREKEENEDAFAIGKNVFAVADGVGSSVNAHLASRLTADELVRQVPLQAFPPDQTVFLRMMKGLSKQVEEQCPKGKSTGVAAWFPQLDGPELPFLGLSLGDSRAYLLKPSSGMMTQLSKDQIINKKDETGKMRKYVTSTFGGFAWSPYTSPLFHGTLRQGEWLLLMTDGVWGYVERHRERFLNGCVNGIRRKPQRTLNQFVITASNSRCDDATIVVIKHE